MKRKNIRNRSSRFLAMILGIVMLLTQISFTAIAEEAQASSQLVLTLGADLTADQKAYVLQYFGITEDRAKVITITNADEKEQLGDLISAEKIGSHTLSCALIRLTEVGGIQVKTANMNYVTSYMIASTLSTSGVNNCEVLTAAPFEVSGTGALTGVMMAYEAGTGLLLDDDKKELANEELIITGDLADSVGQDQATLVVNDIKILIVRDQITDQESINAIVDNVIEVTEAAAEEAAQKNGSAAPAKLGQVEHEKLYNFGYKFGQMDYEYKSMQRTLERVTYNVANNAGIDDPLTDTFTTLDDEIPLDPDSILLNTNDDTLGEDANINATNRVALGEHEAEPIEVFTGEVTIESAGTVKADSFLSGSNVVAYQDLNGKYALMDLNGNLMTESIYTNYFTVYDGLILARIDDGNNSPSLLSADGTVLMEPGYQKIEVLGPKWAAGYTYNTDATEEDYDTYEWDSNNNRIYYALDQIDIFYLGNETSEKLGTLSREDYEYTDTQGDYLNIRNRAGSVVTYDKSFTVVGYPDYTGDFGELDEDRSLRDLISDKTGYYVYSYYGKYAEYVNYDTGKRGIMDRYGNEILPVSYDDISYYYGNEDAYEANGYFGVSIDGTFTYVTAGGEVTGSFGYPFDDVHNYGMSAVYKAEDGSITLLSGDGVECALGTKYSYLYAIRESKGMFFYGDNGSDYDLLDWHGNILISGSDNLSVSANGNYLISADGYTSSTLYLINGASPVGLADSVGGATELEAEVQEAASLDAYTGDPKVTLIGEAISAKFLSGTNYLIGETRKGIALFDLDGQQITADSYAGFEYDNGMIITHARQDNTVFYGIMTADALEIAGCEYNHVKILNENWAVGYILTTGGTEEDYDYKDYSTNELLLIEEAVVYHISGDDLSSVTLTRDQITDIAADGEYLNVQDRTTGNVTTYDSSFTALAPARSVYDFSDYSVKEVLIRRLQDQTGYSVNNSLQDGFTAATDYSNNTKGVIDLEGNIIIPMEYDRIYSYLGEDMKYHYWANGYFAVEKDGMRGYATKDGISCELNYPEDSYNLIGMAGKVKMEDGTYTLVAADGTISEGYDYLNSLGSGELGLFWKAQKGNQNIIIDWHGNVVFESYRSADLSADGKFLVCQETVSSAPQLYAVESSAAEGIMTNLTEEQEEESLEEEEETEETMESEESELSAEPVEPEEEETQDMEVEAEEQTEETEDEENADASSATGDVAAAFLSSAKALVSAGLEQNSVGVRTLLEQAKQSIESENPSAAGILGSAITLLDAGSADEHAVLTLITTAETLLETN